MSKIMVTGSSGFIGSHVVDNLLAKGHQVLAFDRLSRDYPEGVSVFLGDARDSVAVTEAVAISDGVIHLAGVLGTQETIDNPLPAVETNILGGLNIFQAVKQYNKRAVYIAVGNHWMNNSYSITKTTAERFAFMFNKEHGTRIAVVRGLNAYGPRQKAEPVRKIIPNFVLPALDNGLIRIYGDGSQIMDMIHVKDLAEILVRALLVDHNVYDRPFEAGTGRKTTVKEIAETVIKVTKSTATIAYVEMRPGEPDHSVVLGDPETLKPLGELKLTALEEGLKDTVEYYKNEVFPTYQQL